jgi:head-tail adaptor
MSVFHSLLNRTFQVARRRRTSDGRGGWPIDYVAIGSVEGRMRPASSSEREAGKREEREITHVLYVVAGTDIQRGDLASPGVLNITSDGVTASDVLVEVQARREPSHAGEHYEYDCLERQRESQDDGS